VASRWPGRERLLPQEFDVFEEDTCLLASFSFRQRRSEERIVHEPPSFPKSTSPSFPKIDLVSGEKWLARIRGKLDVSLVLSAAFPFGLIVACAAPENS